MLASPQQNLDADLIIYKKVKQFFLVGAQPKIPWEDIT